MKPYPKKNYPTPKMRPVPYFKIRNHRPKSFKTS